MKKVRCVETGDVYKNANDAANKMDICPQSIYQALTKGCAAGKYHFVYLCDEDWVNIRSRRNDMAEIKKLWQIERDKIGDMLVDLFKSWYLKEFTIEECADISGYSVSYLQKRFRSEKIMRGLD